MERFSGKSIVLSDIFAKYFSVEAASNLAHFSLKIHTYKISYSIIRKI